MDKPPAKEISRVWIDDFATITEDQWRSLCTRSRVRQKEPHILGVDFGADGGCAVEGFRDDSGLIYITDVKHFPPIPQEDS